MLIGQQFPFMFVANIVKRDFHLHRTRTVYDKEEQLTWLRRKGEQHGFLLISPMMRKRLLRGAVDALTPEAIMRRTVMIDRYVL
jgi:hypothetical protein